MTRTTYHHGDLRNALVRAGLEILEEQGLTALSLRRIAARAGVSHAAPKNHFGNLSGLLTAIVAEGFRMHEAAMRAAMEAAGPDRPARLRAAMVGYVVFARRNPHLLKLMFSSEQLDNKDEACKAAADASYEVLREISAGLTHPNAAAMPENYAAELMVWCLTHGFAQLAINGFLDRSWEHIGRELSPLDIAPDFAFEP